MPYGYICGWPTQGGGDLYGGNMYAKSAADERGKQAIASQLAVRRWGSGPPGREVIAHPVCKGKYQPWKLGKRQYGCFRHHALRKKKVEKWGPREGWASFEQWPAPPQQPLKSDAEHSKASEAECSSGQCKRPLTSNGKDNTAAQKRRRR